MTTHIRKSTGARWRDRRILAIRNAVTAATLCGDPITDKDMTPADARKAIPAGWALCPRCVSILSVEVVR